MDPEASVTTKLGNDSNMNEKFQILKLLLQFLYSYLSHSYPSFRAFSDSGEECKALRDFCFSLQTGVAIVNWEGWWIRTVHFLSTIPAAAYPCSILYPTALPELQLHICFGCGSCIVSEIINTFNCAHSGCKSNFSNFSLLSWSTGLTTAMLLQETFAPLRTGRYFYLQE